MTERIVSVACLVNGPVVDSPNEVIEVIVSLPPPARHHNILWAFGRIMPEKQGFLTSEGRFVRRSEAAHIAIVAGQVTKLIAAPDLYSEDLW